MDQAPAEDLPPAELRQAIRRIGEQADRAGRVIRSVADFVRRREQARETVSPAALFDAIGPLIHLQAKKTAIRLHTDIAADCPAVSCDRTMVEQVLLNLARNGMQAMPDGEPPLRSGLRVLTMSARPVRPLAGTDASAASGRLWVEFAVTDHGYILQRGPSDAFILEAVNQRWFEQFKDGSKQSWWHVLKQFSSKHSAPLVAVIGLQDAKKVVAPVWLHKDKFIVAASTSG